MWKCLILLSCIGISLAIEPLACCTNPNIIGQGRCSNGNATILNCRKYLVRASEDCPDDNLTSPDCDEESMKYSSGKVKEFNIVDGLLYLSDDIAIDNDR